MTINPTDREQCINAIHRLRQGDITNEELVTAVEGIAASAGVDPSVRDMCLDLEAIYEDVLKKFRITDLPAAKKKEHEDLLDRCILFLNAQLPYVPLGRRTRPECFSMIFKAPFGCWRQGAPTEDLNGVWPFVCRADIDAILPTKNHEEV